MDIKKLIDDLIGREGGYSYHPSDKGGGTKWGVTEAVARAQGYKGDMRALPRDMAASIYHSHYWGRPGFDRVARVAPQIAAELFDTGVNMGPATAIAFLVRALNALNRGGADFPQINAASRIDDAILAALTAFVAKRGTAGESVLLTAINALQAERYISLSEKRPANEAFLYGWLANRVSLGASQ